MQRRQRVRGAERKEESMLDRVIKRTRDFVEQELKESTSSSAREKIIRMAQTKNEYKYTEEQRLAIEKIEQEKKENNNKLSKDYLPKIKDQIAKENAAEAARLKEEFKSEKSKIEYETRKKIIDLLTVSQLEIELRKNIYENLAILLGSIKSADYLQDVIESYFDAINESPDELVEMHSENEAELTQSVKKQQELATTLQTLSKRSASDDEKNKNLHSKKVIVESVQSKLAELKVSRGKDDSALTSAQIISMVNRLAKGETEIPETEVNSNLEKLKIAAERVYQQLVLLQKERVLLEEHKQLEALKNELVTVGIGVSATVTGRLGQVSGVLERMTTSKREDAIVLGMAVLRVAEKMDKWFAKTLKDCDEQQMQIVKEMATLNKELESVKSDLQEATNDIDRCAAELAITNVLKDAMLGPGLLIEKLRAVPVVPELKINDDVEKMRKRMHAFHQGMDRHLMSINEKMLAGNDLSKQAVDDYLEILSQLFRDMAISYFDLITKELMKSDSQLSGPVKEFLRTFVEINTTLSNELIKELVMHQDATSDFTERNVLDLNGFIKRSFTIMNNIAKAYNNFLDKTELARSVAILDATAKPFSIDVEKNKHKLFAIEWHEKVKKLMQQSAYQQEVDPVAYYLLHALSTALAEEKSDLENINFRLAYTEKYFLEQAKLHDGSGLKLLRDAINKLRDMDSTLIHYKDDRLVTDPRYSDAERELALIRLIPLEPLDSDPKLKRARAATQISLPAMSARSKAKSVTFSKDDSIKQWQSKAQGFLKSLSAEKKSDKYAAISLIIQQIDQYSKSGDADGLIFAVAFAKKVLPKEQKSFMAHFGKITSRTLVEEIANDLDKANKAVSQLKVHEHPLYPSVLNDFMQLNPSLNLPAPAGDEKSMGTDYQIQFAKKWLKAVERFERIHPATASSDYDKERKAVLMRLLKNELNSGSGVNIRHIAICVSRALALYPLDGPTLKSHHTRKFMADIWRDLQINFQELCETVKDQETLIREKYYLDVFYPAMQEVFNKKMHKDTDEVKDFSQINARLNLACTPQSPSLMPGEKKQGLTFYLGAIENFHGNDIEPRVLSDLYAMLAKTGDSLAPYSIELKGVKQIMSSELVLPPAEMKSSLYKRLLLEELKCIVNAIAALSKEGDADVLNDYKKDLYMMVRYIKYKAPFLIGDAASDREALEFIYRYVQPIINLLGPNQALNQKCSISNIETYFGREKAGLMKLSEPLAELKALLSDFKDCAKQVAESQQNKEEQEKKFGELKKSEGEKIKAAEDVVTAATKKISSVAMKLGASLAKLRIKSDSPEQGQAEAELKNANGALAHVKRNVKEVIESAESSLAATREKHEILERQLERLSKKIEKEGGVPAIERRITALDDQVTVLGDELSVFSSTYALIRKLKYIDIMCSPALAQGQVYKPSQARQ